jgi:hypothetical protein
LWLQNLPKDRDPSGPETSSQTEPGHFEMSRLGILHPLAV